METCFYLCSQAVIEHFPSLRKSKPFKSGFEFEKEDQFFIIEVSKNELIWINDYHDRVILPFNEKSNVADIDFWMRMCVDSQLKPARRGCLTKCRVHGVFLTIEMIWSLTNATNQAFAIFKMAEYYGLNPIEFINRVVR